MEIAIIADNNKKELMAQFCIAYCGILSRHHLCATYTTGHYISDATGLSIDTLMPGGAGGMEQITLPWTPPICGPPPTPTSTP